METFSLHNKAVLNFLVAKLRTFGLLKELLLQNKKCTKQNKNAKSTF